MKQSSKERYLSQKGTNNLNKGQTTDLDAQGKKTLSSFEKLVIFLVLIFVIAIPLSFLVNKEIMVYVGIINYLILGLAIAVKPEFITDMMRKNSKRKPDEVYEKRLIRLTRAIRVFGILFVGVGLAFFYILVL